ncbi:MAG TPA: hypothetical protein PKN32_13030 [Bacteroidales bacterium]|nr:hypothetical protein [Bacteroidales bacterium]
MKKRFQFLLSVFLIIVISSFGQNENEMQRFSDFIPENYSILGFTCGNLNNDSIDDVILILNNNREDSLFYAGIEEKRIFMMLIGQQDKSYKLSFQSSNIVGYYGYDMNFKDAFVDVVISEATFAINHYGGFNIRWGRSTTFEYNASMNKWFLIKEEFETMESTNLDAPNKLIQKIIRTPEDFGVIEIEEFDITKHYE